MLHNQLYLSVIDTISKVYLFHTDLQKPQEQHIGVQAQPTSKQHTIIWQVHMNAYITHNLLNSLISGAAAAQGMPLMQQDQSHSLGEEEEAGVLSISCIIVSIVNCLSI